MEGALAGAVHEQLYPVGRTHVGQVCGGLSTLGEGPHTRAGEKRGGRIRGDSV